MIIYVKRYFIDKQQIGDTLIYRTRAKAINSMKRGKDYYQNQLSCRVEWIDNLDHSFGHGYMLRFRFTDQDGKVHVQELSRQSTED